MGDWVATKANHDELLRRTSRLSLLPSVRLEQLLDLYAPPIFDDAGELIARDPTAGMISRVQFLRLLDTPT